MDELKVRRFYRRYRLFTADHVDESTAGPSMGAQPSGYEVPLRT
jgi:hypothetical protein